MLNYLSALSAALFLLTAAPALSAPAINQPAPAFEAIDTHGQPVSLAGLKGSIVVLEWTNHECPFVQKFYKNGDMQGFQKDATAYDVNWIRVISSAPGKQGHLSAEEAGALAREQGVAATHTIIDASGELGRLYGAKTTPHMYVINAEGMLIYQGAIDDRASADPADVHAANNYVIAAYEAAMRGETPDVQETRSYGCAVKY